MKVLIFDAETNGLLDALTKAHSLVHKDPETGEVVSCANQPGYTSIEAGLKAIMEADRVVGHNIINFDIPAMTKIYPWFDLPISKVFDTLIMSRLLWPNLKDIDFSRMRKGRGQMPPKMAGRHSLKAWGYRLGVLKGDFGETSDWENWSEQMQEYCELDVEVTEALYTLILTKPLPWKAIEMEHKFALYTGHQERFGFRFDVQAAVQLYAELSSERDALADELRDLFPPILVRDGGRDFTPKRDHKRLGYVAGAPLCKVKEQEFNPASQPQIGTRLQRSYGWRPQAFTPVGQPIVDESTLKGLDYEPCKRLRRYLMLQKRIGQLAEGDKAWLKLERNGRIHGAINTLGAVTGRCTHNKPNVAQVPSVRALYGARMRSLFGPDEGFIQVGADADGLELRCLAHFLHPFDGGQLIETVLKGRKEDGTDSHSQNMRAAGLDNRDDAKTFFYAFLYGAGGEKIGEIIGGGAAEGKKLKAKFLKRTPALKLLRDKVTAKVKNTHTLTGIDGRVVHSRAQHSSLNTLLQSAGGLLVKYATVFMHEALEQEGYVLGEDWAMLAHIHDEYQLQVKPEHVDHISHIACWAFARAGEEFDWRCPLEGSADIGNNWAQCH